MKIHEGKRLNIIVLLIIFVGAIIWVNAEDRLKDIRTQHKKLYDSQLDSCEIIYTSYKRFHSIRGEYKYILTSCKTNSFPLVPEAANYSAKELFQVGSFLTKQSHSNEITIYSNTQKQIVNIAPREKFDDRKTITIGLAVLMFFGIILVLVVPNHKYEEWYKK
tara:strand:+ start:362 stop:850 length:489 start_codon:yes stop_codon:yes gene_type:complete